MLNLDNIVSNKKKISSENDDWPFRMLIIGPSGSGKTNALLHLNSTHYILMKMGNKKELKKIAEKNSGHLDFKEFLKIYNHCTRDPYSFMMVDTRPTARVTFKKNFDESIKNFINNDS